MANPIVRLILAVIAGTVLGGLVVFLVEGAGHMIFPPPADIDLADPASMAIIIDRLPVGSLVMVMVGWFLGSLAGAWLANLIAANSRAGWGVALLFIALTAYTFTKIPHPLWMMVGGVALPLIAAWIAARRTKSLSAPQTR